MCWSKCPYYTAERLLLSAKCRRSLAKYVSPQTAQRLRKSDLERLHRKTSIQHGWELGDEIQGPFWGQQERRKPPFWQLLNPCFEAGKPQIWERAHVGFGVTGRKCKGPCMKQCAWRKHVCATRPSQKHALLSSETSRSTV